MTIETNLDEKTFRAFTMFDILKRRKYWHSPVIFASLLGTSALVCFIMHRIDGAVFLGAVLLLVALGMPILYFTIFFHSLKKQIKAQRLDPPRLVYTLDLDESDKGIQIRNESQKASYAWKDVYRLYRDKECFYLFMTPDRAFLMPYSAIPEGPEALWALALRMLGPERCTNLLKGR